MNNGVLGFCSKQILQCNKSYLHFKLVIITYDSQIATRSTDIIYHFFSFLISTDIIYHFNESTMQLNFMKTLTKFLYTHRLVFKD